MDTQLLLNGVIMAILLVSTAYMLRLNRRLRIMKQGFRDMRGLIEQFSSKVDRSEILLHEMRQSSTEISETMNKQIGRAEQLHDDLTTALAQANVSANRLEKTLQAGERVANSVGRHSPSPRPGATPAEASKRAMPQPGAKRPAGRATAQSTATAPTPRRQPFQSAPKITKPANSAGGFPARRLVSANEEAPAKKPVEPREQGGRAGHVGAGQMWSEESGDYRGLPRTRSAIDSFFETMRSVAE